jgi:hypothetical protein
MRLLAQDYKGHGIKMWLVPAHVIILDPVTAASERLVEGPGVHDRVPQRAVPFDPYA